MGLFSGKHKVDELEARGFHMTRTILEPPPLSLVPAVYQDADARRWAVRFPAAEPAIFDYSDIVACEVVEASDEAPDAADKAGRRELAQQIIAKPAMVSRANAASRKNMCLGMGVVVAVRTGGDGDVSKLQIPIITQEVRRDSRMFEQMKSLAGKLKAEFDAMRVAAEG